VQFLQRGTSRWVLLPLIALLLAAVGLVVPMPAGPVGAFLAVAPVALGLLVVLLLPLAALRRDAVLAIAVVACGIVGSVAFAPPPPPTLTAADANLSVMTWNLHGEPLDRVGLTDALAEGTPDVVILQEARQDTDAVLRLLGSDFTLLPFPDAGTPPGMLLATRLQVVDSGILSEPSGAWDRDRAIWVRLELGGSRLTLVGVHLAVPFPVSSLPCPYCPDLRDRQVSALAEFAAERRAAGDRVVLAGDFNLSERERAYGRLSALTDASRGLTWRPLPVSWLPPLLRLDYVLVSDGIRIASRSSRCDISSSDHCPLFVGLRVE
jgi:endonuclease/exonuclease/phosphatase family metal-dependent hydrolase